HVPETLRPIQINCQQHAADDNQGKRDPITEPSEQLVFFESEQFDQRGDEIAASRDAAEEEVADDPPTPFGVGDEEVHALTSCTGGGAFLVRSRKANNIPSAVKNAVTMLHSDDGGTRRLGSCGAVGSP